MRRILRQASPGRESIKGAAATRYLSASEPHAWKADRNNFQPRAGFTYKLSDKSVLRGGVGDIHRAVSASRRAWHHHGGRPDRVSRNTPVPVTSDNGLTFQANLTNPVPSLQLLRPTARARA